MALKGKTAIITGSSSGIDAAIAKCFAKEGATLSLTGRDKDNLETVAKECQQHCSEDVLTTVGDLTLHETRQTLVQRTKEKFGKIDILINNAGCLLFCPVIKMDEEIYEKQMNINLKTPVLLTALAAPHLIETKGTIVNISSTATTRVPPDVSAYSMSKAGLDVFTNSLALELGPMGVRANSMNCGVVPTQIFSRTNVDDGFDFLNELAKASPLRRYSTPEEMARIAVFLASDASANVTGQKIIADCGTVLNPGY